MSSNFCMVKRTKCSFMKSSDGSFVGTSVLCGGLHQTLASMCLMPGVPASGPVFKAVASQYHMDLTSMQDDALKCIARGQEPGPETWSCILESPPASPGAVQPPGFSKDDDWGDFASPSPSSFDVMSWTTCSAITATAGTTTTFSDPNSGNLSPRTPPASAAWRPSPSSPTRTMATPSHTLSASGPLRHCNQHNYHLSAPSNSISSPSCSIASRLQMGPCTAALRVKEAPPRPMGFSSRDCEVPVVTIAISAGAEKALRHVQKQLSLARWAQRQQQQQKQRQQEQSEASAQPQQPTTPQHQRQSPTSSRHRCNPVHSTRHQQRQTQQQQAHRPLLEPQPTQVFRLQRRLPSTLTAGQAHRLTPRVHAQQPQTCTASQAVASAASLVGVTASRPTTSFSLAPSSLLSRARSAAQMPTLELRPALPAKSRSLKRLPSQAREENGDKVQEGADPAWLRWEDCRVTLQVAQQSSFCRMSDSW